tara:strand:+ start:45223 stop:45903 length:681 start_codon:yes stop_codon:yes gene_type:complete
MVLQQHNIDFLKAIARNNNRDWFMANKDKYEAAHQNSIEFAEAVLQGLQSVDEIETASGKKSLMRIYRDVRFSKDKTPYKNNWGGGFKRAGENRRGSFYFHIEPGNSFVGGGFWNPESDDLKRIRLGISLRQNEFEKIVLSKEFKAVFGELQGDKLKTCPKGFDKTDPALKWLQHKQFLISKKFSDKEVLSPDYAKKVTETFEAMLPFFNIMTEFLTTSPDGESLL